MEVERSESTCPRVRAESRANDVTNDRCTDEATSKPRSAICEALAGRSISSPNVSSQQTVCPCLIWYYCTRNGKQALSPGGLCVQSYLTFLTQHDGNAHPPGEFHSRKAGGRAARGRTSNVGGTRIATEGNC